MNNYILKGGVVFHKCRMRCGDRGICDFTTSSEGITTLECRQCGNLISISELITEAANHYATPVY